jgi:hypothetical protein
VHREVRGNDVIQVVEGHGERHGRTRADTRAVGGHDGGSADPSRVDEDLAAALVLHELDGRHVGVDASGSAGDGTRGGRRVLERGSGVDGHEDVDALGPAGLHRPLQAHVGEGLAHEPGSPHGDREVSALGWVEVEHEVGGVVGAGDLHQRGVVLDRSLVGEPEQRPTVVAQGVRHIAFGGLGPQRHRLDPRRRGLRDVLLHERLLPPVHPDHRQRPVAEPGDDPVADPVQVVDQIALRRSGAIEERRVQVREGDALARLAAAIGTHQSRRYARELHP